MERLLILAQFAPAYLERLRRRFEVFYESWLDTAELLDPQSLGKRLRRERIDYLVIEADFVLAETFAAAPNLRFVGVCRGEIGPHVDMDAAARHGVTVVSTPGRNAVAVAELALGFMLALARRLPQAHDLVRGGHWDSALTGYGAWGGIELAGRTAGLIGLGAVGRAVAHRLRGLEMRVLATDPFVPAAPDGLAEMVDLATLVRQSDFISLHCPLTPATRNLVDAAFLAQAKPGVFFINTARAALVDEDALLDALHTGHVAGVALDVHRIEPLPPNSPWLAVDRAILTPHIGGASVDVVGHHSRLITEALEEFVRVENQV